MSKVNLDPADREWEYDGDGQKIYKPEAGYGSKTPYYDRALIVGNGESRKWFTEKQHDVRATVWGCNAVYRDTKVDNLVAVDYGMQQEIYTSGYWHDTKCWFTNWSILPSEVGDMMFMGYDIPESFVHKTSNRTDRCVISGKDPVTLQEKIEVAMKMNPDLDMVDLRNKMEKDVGVWITYVEEDDNINNVDFPVGWSTGNTAIHLACQSGAEEVYIVGFDLSAYDEPLNNVYKGTDNYLSSDAKGFNSTNWINQMQTVFTEFRDIKFYWIDPVDRFGQKDFFQNGQDGKFNNLSYLTKDSLCDKLNIL
jgi:hypothetical protein